MSTHSLTSGKVTYDISWVDGQLGRLQTPATGDGGEGGTGSSQQQQQDTSFAATAEQQPSFILQVPGSLPTGLSAAADTDGAASGNAEEAAAAAGEAMELDEQPASQGPSEAAADQHDSSAGDHGGIFIGSVQLSEVKSALAKAGFVSEFRAGKLVIGGMLVVKRDGPEGQLVLEGPLCDDYFKVRDVVYGQYNVC